MLSKREVFVLAFLSARKTASITYAMHGINDKIHEPMNSETATIFLLLGI